MQQGTPFSLLSSSAAPNPLSAPTNVTVANRADRYRAVQVARSNATPAKNAS